VVFQPGSSNIVYIATDFVAQYKAEVWKIENVFSTCVYTQLNTIPANNVPDCERFALDVKNDANGNPSELYCGGLHGTSFSIYKIDLQNNSAFIPYIEVILAMTNSMCEFEMSDVTNDAYITCGYFFESYKNRNQSAQIFNGQTPGNKHDEIYHTDTRSLDYIVKDNKEMILIGNDGGVTFAFKNSPSADYVFQNVNGRGLYISQLYDLGFCQSDPSKMCAGAQDNHIMKNGYDPGWVCKVEFPGDGYNVIIHPSDPDYAYFIMGGGSTPSGILRTTNGFDNKISSILNLTSNDNTGYNEKPISFKPGDPSVAYVGYQNVYKSTDWNSNFNLFFDRASRTDSLVQDEEIVDIAIAPSNSNVMYVAYDHCCWQNALSDLIRTTNANDPTPVWITIPNTALSGYPVSCRISHLAVAQDDPFKLWVTFGGFWPSGGTNHSRVLQSFDGGKHFTDITKPNSTGGGLPNLPINCIKTIGDASTGYKIFIGNDLGVYYQTVTINNNSPAYSGWTLFSHNLPPAIVTDIEYIQSAGKPDALRIATFGYGIWETPIDCSISQNYETISTSVTWNADQVKHNNVYIAPGGSLTITSKISFVEGTGLFVQEGGQLYVTGGTLTNACGSQWNGITVYGDPGQRITNLTYQGYCVLNNALIENAIVGVKTLGGLPDFQNGGTILIDEYPAGGIIKGNNTTFRNNYISVLINPCREDKIDQFKSCIFEINSELLHPYTDAGPLVKLVDVNKVYFQGCTFRTSTTFSPNQSIGTGILSNNSTFYVDAQCIASYNYECTQWKYSEFSNLDYGVKALAWSPTRTFRVDKANFGNNNIGGNNTGIYASGISTAQVSRSNFYVNAVDTIVREHFGGLYLDHCNGYKIEENHFYSNSTSPQIWKIGALVNNSNIYPFESADNKIYNNSFQNLDIGIIAQNRNKSSDGLHGLTIKCNDFTASNRYDIAVTTYNSGLPGMGIKYQQGAHSNNPLDPAGNTFSDHLGNFWGYDYRYHNEGASFLYNHHDSAFTPPIYKVSLGITGHFGSANITPQYYSGNGFLKSSCCPSSFIPVGGGGGIDDDMAAMDSANNGVDSTQNLLDQLVDGGNTDQLASDIQTSTSPEAVPLYDELIAKSPYLSDTVMITAVSKESVISSSMIADILSSNPQAAKSEKVLEEVDNRFNPLTDEQKSQVMEGLTTIGGKEVLESQLAGYNLEYSYALNNVIRYFRGDSLCPNSDDSISGYLSNCNYIWARYQEAFIRNETHDSAGASVILSAIPQEFTLTPVTQTEHQYFSQLMTIENAMKSSDKSLLQVDSMQIVNLNTIKQGSEGMMKVYARNLLYGIQGITDYSEPYQLPQPGLKESKIRWVTTAVPSQNSLKLYPNPANNYVIAEYFLKDQKLKCKIRLFGNAGELLKEAPVFSSHGYCKFVLDGLTPGMYICKIMCDNGTLDAVKLIIQK